MKHDTTCATERKSLCHTTSYWRFKSLPKQTKTKAHNLHNFYIVDQVTAETEKDAEREWEREAEKDAERERERQADRLMMIHWAK